MRQKIFVGLVGIAASCVAALSFLDIQTAANVLASVGTFTLAFFAYMEIRNSRRERRLANLDREVERVFRSTGLEFLPALGFLVEYWWNDRTIGKQTREMQKHYDEKRDCFKEKAKSLRSEIISLKTNMLEAHPETADNGNVGQSVAGTTDGLELDLSFARFDQLADGAELAGKEKPDYSTYNSLPHKRDIESEEKTVERQMLDIIEARLNNMKSQEMPVEQNVQANYARLKNMEWRSGFRFANWKRVAPERAMRELLATAKSLDRRVAIDTEPEIDQESWEENLCIEFKEEPFDEGFYKSLLSNAADGLRTRLS